MLDAGAVESDHANVKAQQVVAKAVAGIVAVVENEGTHVGPIALQVVHVEIRSPFKATVDVKPIIPDRSWRLYSPEKFQLDGRGTGLRAHQMIAILHEDNSIDIFLHHQGVYRRPETKKIWLTFRVR